MTHALITGRITPPGSEVAPGRLRVTAKPETTDNALKFPGERVTWGPTLPVITNESGDLGSGLKIPVDSATPGVLWKFTVEPIDRNPSLPPKWVVGPYAVTANIRFDELIEVATTAVTPAIIESVSGYAAEAALARDEAIEAKAGAEAVGAIADTQIAGRVSDPASATAVALSATYVSRRRVLDEQEEPIYIAHRGGYNVFPESTMEAFRGSVAAGCQALEYDVVPLADGALAVSHDFTVDRVSTSTGNVSAHTSMSWQSLVQDWGPAGLTGSWKMPLNAQVLNEFGGRVLLVPETKGNTGAALAAEIVKLGIQDSCLVQSFALSDLAPIVAAGIPAMFCDLDGVFDIPTVVAAGVKYVGFDYSTATNAQIAAWIAAGLKPVAFTANRREDRDRLLGLGVVGIITDEPAYMADNLPALATDPFRAQTYYHGHLSNNLDRGSFVAPNRFYLGTLGGKTFFLQGWAEKKIRSLGTSWSMTMSVTFDAVGSNTANWFACFFGQPTDFAFADDGNVKGNGWNMLFRANGTLALYKVTNGATSLIGTAPTVTAVASGGTAQLKITVTPTEVKIERLDVATSYTTNDASHGRGSYAYFGRNDAGGAGLRCSSSAVTIA